MREPYDVIGGDKLGQLTSQPPRPRVLDALREWGLLLPGVRTRSETLRLLAALGRAATLDDDGARLDDESIDVFCNLPNRPSGWHNPDGVLEFRLAAAEKAFLRRKLSVLARPGSTALSLLARLVDAGETYPGAARPPPAARRKTSSRARLANTMRSAVRRAEWNPARHRTTPLHYRWLIVRQMLNDVGGHS